MCVQLSHLYSPFSLGFVCEHLFSLSLLSSLSSPDRLLGVWERKRERKIERQKEKEEGKGIEGEEEEEEEEGGDWGGEAEEDNDIYEIVVGVERRTERERAEKKKEKEKIEKEGGGKRRGMSQKKMALASGALRTAHSIGKLLEVCLCFCVCLCLFVFVCVLWRYVLTLSPFFSFFFCSFLIVEHVLLFLELGPVTPAILKVFQQNIYVFLHR